MIYVELFWSFFQIGLFAFGGGYAALPLIKARIVDLHGWLTPLEFTDIVTISQMTPGPIGINAATFVGARVGGVAGSVVATIGGVTPSFIIVLILARIYTRYNNLKIIQEILGNLRPAIVGLIASAGLSIAVLAFWRGNPVHLGLEGVDLLSVILFFAGLFALIKLKLNPIYVMLGTGVVGLAVHFIQ